MSVITDQLAEILNMPANAITDEKELDSFADWDSLAMLSVSALADSHYGFQIGSRELSEIRTVGELVSLVQNQKTKN